MHKISFVFSVLAAFLELASVASADPKPLWNIDLPIQRGYQTENYATYALTNLAYFAEANGKGKIRVKTQYTMTVISPNDSILTAEHTVEQWLNVRDIQQSEKSGRAYTFITDPGVGLKLGYSITISTGDYQVMKDSTLIATGFTVQKGERQSRKKFKINSLFDCMRAFVDPGFLLRPNS